MLDSFNVRFSLKGGEYYLTERDVDAYRIKSGFVLVYVVPLKKGLPGRRSFLYEASEGEVIPGFCFRDMEYVDWRFLFVALETATLEIIENGSTKYLRKVFAEKARIKNYEKEGYSGGIVDQYRINIVTEDGFIRRTELERSHTATSILSLIYSAFNRKKIEVSSEGHHNSIYGAMAILCKNQNISIAPYEKIKEACGDAITVSDIARISHFPYREIILDQGWHKEDSGPFVAFAEKNKPIVCIPKGSNSYIIYDVEGDMILPVTNKVLSAISPRAYMIYRPLPATPLTFKDLASFCRKSIKGADLMQLFILTLFTSLVGLLTPTISQKLYDEYIPLGAQSLLIQIGFVLASFMLANILFSIVKNLVTFRITSRMAYDTQSAFYDRLFNLPESFFRDFESADLAQRVMGSVAVVNTVANIIIMAAVAIVFAAVSFIRMTSYSWHLTLIALLMILVYSICFYLISIRTLKYQEKIVKLEGETGSIMFQLLNGIAKIRIAGVEDRALLEYLKPYVELRNHEEKKERIADFGTVLSMIANSIFSIILYIVIIKSKLNISLGAFIAFITVFGMFTAYFLQLVEGFINLKNERPNMDRLKPLLEAIPETDDAKELPGEITGAIEINGVTFAYSENSPNVLENISLNIKPGEYVGIVGPSGCGKSTLLKLLLGFERPNSGKIYYDNLDIESVDKRELRKKIGVVLQDGKLISGSIFENITITAPTAKVADVNEVIKAVGLEKDIEEMPMRLHTVLSEDCGTISGGQQQRILIARAIVSNPRILFFDEATSALDNITQSIVCETLEKMDSTRIVIAHRLSTIINCDRILVMSAGKIAEQGNYEELMAMQGLFYQLASRQM